MDVDGHPDAATVKLDGLVMQSHGTGEKIYASLQREIAGHLRQPALLDTDDYPRDSEMEAPAVRET